MEHVRCKKCQKFFIPIRSDQRLCSDKCRTTYKYYTRKPVLHKVCKHCKSKFTTRLEFQDFCCDKCRTSHHRSLLNREILTRRCKNCGNVFETTDSRQIYCDRNCRYEAKLIRENKRYKEKMNENI